MSKINLIIGCKMRLPYENRVVFQNVVSDRDSMRILLSFLNNADLINFMMIF